MLYMSSWDEKDVIWNEEQGVLAIKPKRTIYGDMTFLCYEQLPGGERRLLFRYWIHTAFLPTSNEQSNGLGLNTVWMMDDCHVAHLHGVQQQDRDHQRPADERPPAELQHEGVRQPEHDVPRRVLFPLRREGARAGSSGPRAAPQRGGERRTVQEAEELVRGRERSEAGAAAVGERRQQGGASHSLGHPEPDEDIRLCAKR